MIPVTFGPRQFAVLAAIVSLFLVGCCRRGFCATPAQQGSLPLESKTFAVTDARGKLVRFSKIPHRIVSLAPSLTEIVFALGKGKDLVADTLSCDYPAEARNLPHINPLNPDREKIEIQTPDLVLAQAKFNSIALIEALERDKIPVVVIGADSLSDTYNAIQTVGVALEARKQAVSLVQQMQNTIKRVTRTVVNARTRPGILMMYGCKPIYTTGPDSFITEIITAAGGENVVREKLPSGTISSSQVLLLKPDVIICDRGLIQEVKQLPGWSIVPAVKNDRFFQTSSRTTLVRPGPRLPLAIEELARYLHPELYH